MMVVRHFTTEHKVTGDGIYTTYGLDYALLIPSLLWPASPDRHVRLPIQFGKPLDLDTLAEDEAVTLVHLLALLDGNVARADLVHADADRGYGADGRVVGLDEDDGPA